MRKWAGLSLMSAFASPCLAAIEAGGASPWVSGMQVLFALACVIGLIYLSGWLVRRAGVLNQRVGDLRVLGGVALGARERLVVVDWRGRKLLLGVTPQQITPLAVEEGGTLPESFAGEFGTEISRAIQKDNTP